MVKLYFYFYCAQEFNARAMLLTFWVTWISVNMFILHKHPLKSWKCTHHFEYIFIHLIKSHGVYIFQFCIPGIKHYAYHCQVLIGRKDRKKRQCFWVGLIQFLLLLGPPLNPRSWALYFQLVLPSQPYVSRDALGSWFTATKHNLQQRAGLIAYT